MAGGSSSTDGMGFGGRLLIILFGVGIVAIGLDIFQARYGGFGSYVRRLSGRALQQVGNYADKGYYNLRAYRFRLGQPEGETSRSAGDPEWRKIERERAARPVGSPPASDARPKPIAEPKPEKKLDHMTTSDRKELNDLINKLD